MGNIEKKSTEQMEKFHKALAPYQITFVNTRGKEYELTIGLHDEVGSGYYEIFDTETFGELYHAEGYLEFDRFSLTGYDGCFELDKRIIQELESFGFKNEL